MTASQTEGYAALVAARAPALLRLAVMLTGDRTEAEDLLQSTPCPRTVDQRTDRIVFHTLVGDVVAVDHTGDGGLGMMVRRDGRVVNPQLGDAQTLLAALGIPH